MNIKAEIPNEKESIQSTSNSDLGID